MHTPGRRGQVYVVARIALVAVLLSVIIGCTATGAWDDINAALNPPETPELPDDSDDPEDSDDPGPTTVDSAGGGDYTTIQAAIDAAAPGDTIEVAPGSYGSEGAAGDPIVVDVADLTIRGAFAGTSGHDAARAGNGVLDASGTRSGAAYVVATSDESEIDDPVRITASGVTIDGFTFDVTGIFGFSGNVELSGGNAAVEFGSGTRIRNSRFIETVGSDSGAANQGEIAAGVGAIDGLEVSNNIVFGEATGLQIGAADFFGSIEITANVIVNGSLNLTVGPASTAEITIAGNVVSGVNALGINGTGFAADEVPIAVLENLNDVAAENEFFGGVFTLAASEGDDDLRRFASALRDFFYGDEGDDLIAGLGGDDELFGGGGDDVLEGGTGDDVLSGDGNFAAQTGVPGDDTLRGGPGDDTLDGGPGTDVAEFSAPMGEYTIVVDDQGTPADPTDDITTVEHTGGSGIDGTDIITNVESFVWSAY